MTNITIGNFKEKICPRCKNKFTRKSGESVIKKLCDECIAKAISGKK